MSGRWAATNPTWDSSIGAENTANLYLTQTTSPRKDLGALTYEVDVGSMGDDSAVEAHVQNSLNCFTPVRSVVERALVDVHSDEAVGKRGIEVAGKLHGIGEGLFAV